MVVELDEVMGRLLTAASELERHTGLRTCIIGGIARDIWAERRATADVDVIIDSPDARVVLPHAQAVGLTFVQREVDALEKSSMTRLRLPEELTGETRLDVIARSHEYYARVLDRSVLTKFLDVAVRVACAEDIVVLKVLADRPVDRADVDAIVRALGDKLDRELIRKEAAAFELELPEILR